jgi:hypothetical protein
MRGLLVRKLTFSNFPNHLAIGRGVINDRIMIIYCSGNVMLGIGIKPNFSLLINLQRFITYSLSSKENKKVARFRHP